MDSKNVSSAHDKVVHRQRRSTGKDFARTSLSKGDQPKNSLLKEDLSDDRDENEGFPVWELCLTPEMVLPSQSRVVQSPLSGEKDTTSRKESDEFAEMIAFQPEVTSLRSSKKTTDVSVADKIVTGLNSEMTISQSDVTSREKSSSIKNKGVSKDVVDVSVADRELYPQAEVAFLESSNESVSDRKKISEQEVAFIDSLSESFSNRTGFSQPEVAYLDFPSETVNVSTSGRNHFLRPKVSFIDLEAQTLTDSGREIDSSSSNEEVASFWETGNHSASEEMQIQSTNDADEAENSVDDKEEPEKEYEAIFTPSVSSSVCSNRSDQQWYSSAVDDLASALEGVNQSDYDVRPNQTTSGESSDWSTKASVHSNATSGNISWEPTSNRSNECVLDRTESFSELMVGTDETEVELASGDGGVETKEDDQDGVKANDQDSFLVSVCCQETFDEDQAANDVQEEVPVLRESRACQTEALPGSNDEISSALWRSMELALSNVGVDVQRLSLKAALSTIQSKVEEHLSFRPDPLERSRTTMKTRFSSRCSWASSRTSFLRLHGQQEHERSFVNNNNRVPNYIRGTEASRLKQTTPLMATSWSKPAIGRGLPPLPFQHSPKKKNKAPKPPTANNGHSDLKIVARSAPLTQVRSIRGGRKKTDPNLTTTLSPIIESRDHASSSRRQSDVRGRT